MIFKYIEANKAVCMNTMNSLGRRHLDAYLYRVTFELLIGVVNEVSLNMKVSVEDKEFVANFYTLSFTALVIQWMENKMQEEPEIIIEKLNELIEGNFQQALNRYEVKNE